MGKKLLRLYFLLLVVLCNLLLAYGSSSAQSPYLFNYTDEHGLPSMRIHRIAQDNQGYIWLATEVGLYRFDGKKFKHFYSSAQTSFSIIDLRLSPTGIIWCQTSSNQLLHVKNDSLHYLTEITASLDGNALRDFKFVSSNEIWYCTSFQLNRYYIREQVIEKLEIGLLKNRRLKFMHIVVTPKKKDILIPSGNEHIFKYIGKDNFKLVWGDTSRILLSKGRGLTGYNSGENIMLFEPYVQKDEYLEWSAGAFKEIRNPNLNKGVIGVYRDRNKNKWWYGAGGVWIEAAKDNMLAKVKKPILSNTRVLDILQDQEGGYWFTTENNGLWYMANPNVIYFDTKNSNLSESSVGKLNYLGKNKMFLGCNSTNQHVIFDLSSSQEIDKVSTDFTSVIESVYSDTSQELAYFCQMDLYQLSWNNVGYQAKSPYKITARHIKDWSIIDHNHLLVASLGGPKITTNSFYDPSTYEETNGDWLPIVHKSPWGITIHRAARTRCLKVDRQKRWWIGYNDSLYVIEGKKFHAILNRGKTIKAKSIVQDHTNTVWVGTITQGILKFDGRSITARFSKNTILENRAVTVLCVNQNLLWIGTKSGLFTLDIRTNKMQKIDKTDGLVSDEINDIYVKDDIVYIATVKGLVCFSRTQEFYNKHKPPIILQQISINGKEYPIKRNYELSHNQNNIILNLKALAFKARGKYKYIYSIALNGGAERWSEVPGSQDQLYLLNLASGKYSFRFYAVNEDGLRSANPVELTVNIAFPFWRTWWFFSLMSSIFLLVLGSTIAWMFYRYRRKQKIEKTINNLRLQALQTQMNPHFVFNALNAIQMLVATKNTESAMMYLSKFAKLIRRIFDMSEQLVHELEEEIAFLQLYISIEKLRFEDDISIDFSVNDSLLAGHSYFIPPLILQPIIENSFRHGLLHKKEAGQLSIKLDKVDNFLYVVVEDDGVGRKYAQQLSSWKKDDMKLSGLHVTQKRLDLLGGKNKTFGKMKITDLFDDEGKPSGTRTEVWISLEIR